MTDFKNLTKQIIDFRNKRGWKKYHSPKNNAIGLMIEAAELLEIFNYSLNNKVPQNQKKHLQEELMDVLYWVLIIAYEQKIDISQAFKEKMNKNKIKYPTKAR